MIEIPRKALLTEAQAIATNEVVRKVVATQIPVYCPPATILGIFVYLVQKEPTHPWHAVAMSFPTQLAASPLFYSREDMEFLRGTTLFGIERNESVGEVDKERERLRKEYDTLLQAVPELGAISVGEYMKIWLLAHSRYFSFQTAKLGNMILPIIGIQSEMISRFDQSFRESLGENVVGLRQRYTNGPYHCHRQYLTRRRNHD